MAKANTPPAYAGDTLAIGPALVDTAWLRQAAVESYARTGVVLANERIKVTIMHGDTPVAYVLSMYAQREPVTEDEAIKVASTKAERDSTKAARDLAADEKLAREKQFAFRLGKESAQGAPPDLAQVVQTAKALSALGLKF